MRFTVLLTTLLLAACATSTTTPTNEAPTTPEPPAVPDAQDAPLAPEPPAMTMGNGERNWIIVDGATRDGQTFEFAEVHIDGNGWLVMHPFENGKPNGDVVSGSTYVANGTNTDVNISVTEEVAAGDMFIVMLHRDVDEDREFDFVFVGDTGHVEDKAVFEGNKMIGHAYPAP